MKELHAIISRLTGVPLATTTLATLVTVEGSSYRRPGARLLVEPDGTRLGSISGGCLDEDVMARADRVMRTGEPELALYDTTKENDLLWGVGLGCRGTVQILVEKLEAAPDWALQVKRALDLGQPCRLGVVWNSGGLRPGTRLAGDFASPPPSHGVFWQTVEPATPLFIFGAGDDAQPLAALAKELGWKVTIADPRPGYATASRFRSADSVLCAPADSLVATAMPGPTALAVVMTHHYIHDLPIIRDLLGRPLAYLGLLGPKARAEKILEDLAAAGHAVSPERREGLRAPTGLDLGGDGSEEVALSILAEMRAVLAGRDGRPLRERVGPIHG